MRKTKKVIALLMSALMFGGTIGDTGITAYAGKEADISDANLNKVSEEVNNPYEFDYLELNKEIIESSPVIEDETELLEDIYDVPVTENATENADDVEYPASIDWSKSEYFPAVGNQSYVGNCGYWASYYTNLTFSYNKANGIKTTPENTFNPFFGFKFYGKSLESDEVISQTIGHPSIGVLPLDYDNMNTFTPYKEVWEDAVKHRIVKFENYNRFGTEDTLITGPKDPDLNEMKKAFNDGFLVGIGTLAGKWNFSVIPEGEFKGEKIIDRLDVDGLGGHGVTLVGYNDDIWTDINLDGIKQEAEFGAFKMVNSWGPDWCNKGFTWIAYDAFNNVSQVLTAADEQRINSDIASGKISANKVSSSLRTSMFMFSTFSTMKIRERDTSNCLCYMTVNTGSRKEMVMSVTATHKQSGESSTYKFPTISKDTVNYAWDGSTSSTDATFVFDLDNVIPDITAETMEDYSWSVLFGDTTKDTTAVTVKDLYFGVNGSKKYVTSLSKIPLNGSEKTYTMFLKKAGMQPDAEIVAENEKNITIYYANSNFEDANIHYKTNNGTWTTAPGVQMCVTDEQQGYTWKYVVNLGTGSSLTVCFNEENTVWDSNGGENYSITKAGCYGIKNGTIAELEEVEIIEEPTIEFDKTSENVMVGNSTMITPTVTDGAVEDIVWTTSNEDVAIVTSTGRIYAVGVGNATITASIGKVSASCEVTVEKGTVTPPIEIETPKADSIKLNQETLKLYEGKTATLVATVVGESEDTVKWKSSDENVAIVSSNGKVVGVGEGTATVTAYIDEVSASCEVIVEKETVTPPTGISPTITPPIGNETPRAEAIKLDQETLKLYEGMTATLVETVVGQSEDTVKWKSSNENVAIVSSNGKVVGVGEGTATVTAYIDEVSASCEVTVEKGSVIPSTGVSPIVTPPTGYETPKAEAIKLDQGTLKLYEGKTATLVATIAGESEDTIKWKSSDENVAIVSSNGKVIGVGKGTATVTAYIDEVSVSCEVTVEKATVTPPTGSETPKADSIKLDQETLKLYEGKTAILVATVAGESEDTIKWKSSAENVVIVSSNGKVIGVGEGSATVTVSIDGVSASCEVTVEKETVTTPKKDSLTLNKTKYTLYTAGRKKLTLTATLNGTKLSSNKVTWSSSNTNVAKVNSKGVVTAKKAGKATITAVASNGLKIKCTITVKKPSIKLKTKSAITLKVGTTLKIKVTSTPGGKFTYKTSSKKIATVSSKGVIKAKKKGTAYITVSRNGVKKKIKVKVK